MSNLTQGLYRCFSTGLTKRKLIPANDTYISEVEELINKEPDKDYYESIYLYGEEHFKKFKESNSLAGISDVKTNRIVFDFDSKSNVTQALQDARGVVERLAANHIPENSIRIYYSGAKGTHVEVHLNQLLNRPEFENVVEYLAGDLQTFDRVIKDHQRLFRFPLTRNSKTKRFKIPLTVNQLNTLTLEQIEKLSLKTDHTEFYQILNDYEVTDLPIGLKNLKKKEEKLVSDAEVLDKPNLSRKPKHLTAAKWVLQQGFFEEGERNEACMILASTYKYLEYDAETTYNIIKATLRMRAKRLGLGDYDKAELWRTIVTPVFSPTWKGGTFTEEDGLLKRTIDRYNLDKTLIGEVGLVELTSLSSGFRNFASNIDSNTIKLGIDEIDRKVRITTGMLVAFLAAPGGGKSSASFGILNTLSKSGEKAIFFSMDMGADQVFQRLIQRHTGHQADTILNNYKNNRIAEMENYENLLSENYSNIKFCFKTALTPELIRAMVVQEFQMTGTYPKMILLDYLECIQTNFSDPSQSKAAAALALKDIANEFGVCVFLLTQPTKLSGGPAGELTSYFQIKGSGVTAEQATIVLTMSRPGFDPKHPEDDNYVTINVVKNRLGPLSSTDLHWNGLTGHIRSLSHEEENDLKALREAIAARNNDNKKSELY